MCIDKLDNIVKEYLNINYRTIKMKAIDVNTSTYIDFELQNNDKYSTFRVADCLRISKHKIIFPKVIKK